MKRPSDVCCWAKLRITTCLRRRRRDGGAQDMTGLDMISLPTSSTTADVNEASRESITLGSRAFVRCLLIFLLVHFQCTLWAKTISWTVESLLYLLA